MACTTTSTAVKCSTQCRLVKAIGNPTIQVKTRKARQSGYVAAQPVVPQQGRQGGTSLRVRLPIKPFAPRTATRNISNSTRAEFSGSLYILFR